MSRYMTELFYGKPEPAWLINSRRRQYGDSQYSGGSYSGQPSFGPYSQGSALPDTVLRVPLINLEDVARIKDALSVEGVYNVVCDIPEQAVTVSSNLPPQTIVGLVRRVFLNAHIVNYINPYSSGAGAPRTYPAEPSFGLSGQPTRAYDDSYSYWGHTNYTPAYESAYRGRSYDNEFRPSYYAPSSSYGYP
ncbi:hypothetical protein BDL97_17G010500 [Sphagnum fallax]|nr:hypothetical protein BDL97_17G010500 [Sphagnum fallax]